MKALKRWLLIWFFMGEQYFVLEALYRFFFKGGELAHPAMLPVGGLCVLLVGAINQYERFYELPMLAQSVLGTLITLVVEFLSGLLLNLHLGWAIWDYTGMAGNIMGQVCLSFALIWLWLMPMAIWAEDAFRAKVLGEGEYYPLKQNYIELISNLVYLFTFGRVRLMKKKEAFN